MTEKVGEIVYTVDADVRPFLQKMDSTTTRLEQFDTAADKANKSADSLGKSTSGAAKAVDSMGKSMDQGAKSVDGVTESMGEQAKAAETTEQAIARIAATVKIATPAIQDLEKATSVQSNGMIRATTAQEAAARATAQLAQQSEAAVSSVSGIERQTARLTNQMASVKKVTEEEAQAISALMGRIDPTSAKIRKLDADIDLLNKTFDEGKISAAEHAAALAKAEKQMTSLEAKTGKTSLTSTALTAALTPLAAALAGLKLAEMLKGWNAMSEQFGVARFQLQQLLGSAQLGADAFQKLVSVSMRMGTTVEETQKVFTKLQATLQGTGRTSDQIVKLTETVQQLGAMGGTSGAQVAQAVETMTKSIINGKASAEDLLSVLRNAPGIGTAIANGLGVTLQELQRQLKAGEINGEQMLAALEKGADATNRQFQEMPRTVAEAGAAMQTAFGNAVRSINDALGAGNTLVKIMDRISKGVDGTFGNVPDEAKINELMTERLKLTDRLSKMSGGLSPLKDEYQKRLDGINKEISAIQERRVEIQKTQKAQKDSEDAAANSPDRKTESGQKELKNLRESIALLKLSGEEKAKQKALQKLGDKASAKEIEDAMALAVEEYNLTKGIADKKKKDREDESAAKKAATQAKQDDAKADAILLAQLKAEERHAAQNKKVIDDLATSTQIAAKKTRELAQEKAAAKLNAFATDEDVAKVKALAGALYDVQQAKANKKLLAEVDPMVGETAKFEKEMEDLRKLNEAKLVENDRYLELKSAAEYQHSLTMQKLAEEDFARQSFTNKFLMDGINALAAATTQTLSGLLSGTMNARQAMQSFANVILNQAVGAIVELGFAQVKAALVGKVANQAAAASYAAGVSAQVQATSFLAAQAAYASTAAIPVVGPAMAPAAAATAQGVAQGLGAPAVAFAAASGRFNGGTVDGSSMYRVNEGGGPEIFNAANGSQYMLPGQRGEVVSNKNAGGGTITNVITISIDSGGNSSQGGNGAEDSKMLASTLSSVVVNEMNNQLRPGGILWEMQNG